VHEDIKLGKPTRDRLIESFCQNIRNCAAVGVKVICYNFMPVFDWLRTDLWHPLPDGSTALFYEKAVVEQMSPEKLIADMKENSGGLTLPGWEPNASPASADSARRTRASPTRTGTAITSNSWTRSSRRAKSST